MLTKNLQIGDYVYRNHDDKQSIITIERLSDSHTILDDCEPIPITSEFLLNNGFVLKHNPKDNLIAHIYIVETKDYQITLFKYLDSTVMTVINKNTKDNCNIDVKYVHEFQHALNICNLTDKFILTLDN